MLAVSSFFVFHVFTYYTYCSLVHTAAPGGRAGTADSVLGTKIPSQQSLVLTESLIADAIRKFHKIFRLEEAGLFTDVDTAPAAFRRTREYAEAAERLLSAPSIASLARREPGAFHDVLFRFRRFVEEPCIRSALPASLK